MNPLNSRRIQLVGAFVLCALTARFAMADQPDSLINMHVRLAILTAHGVEATAVKVDTDNGFVTIHGKVGTPGQKERAEATARSVDGVKNVNNLLEVVPDYRKNAVKASDDFLKKQLQGTFKADKDLDGIHVESVDNGVVLLSGHARTLSDKVRAIQTAYDTDGVRGVTSKIESSDN